MNDKILKRIERDAGVPDLVQLLSERISPGDLQSLLLAVYQRRAGALDVQHLLRRFSESRFIRSSGVSPRRLRELATEAALVLPPVFEEIELSPLLPLGSCTSIAAVHQHNVLSTIRNLEVISDPAIALALECALRRKLGDTAHLAAGSRVVRTQYFGDDPNLSAHFYLFALCSAGRWSHSFEEEVLLLHLRYYLRLLKAWFPHSEMSLRFSALQGGERPAGYLGEVLPKEFPWLNLAEETATKGRETYYDKICFKLYVDDTDVGDGGFTDWTRQLLSDGKECLLSTGIALEKISSLTL